MEEKDAIKTFTALAQEHRLRIFRVLTREGADGLTASAIADAVSISRTNVSFHLKELENSGLLTSTRHGRHIRYAIVVNAVRDFINYLTGECCHGRPELCDPSREAKTSCKPREKTHV
ncbi:MAG: metalloregulator ArsR/SmtB family transcription factor [Hyphomicrobiales bacterium]|nr:metalloregulator ArsR/SmtB family transcription factor [Hyphomicrobiales bacterium]